MVTPLVSIIVPFYNASKYFSDLLTSIDAQTIRDLEIIVVDDASDQHQSSVLPSIITNFPSLKVRVIHNANNLGVSQSRNVGLEASVGKFITFIDNDDMLCGRYSLEYRIHFLNEYHEFDAVGGYSQHVDKDGKLCFPPTVLRPEFVEASINPDKLMQLCCKNAIKYSENFISVLFLVAGGCLFRRDKISNCLFDPLYDTEEDFEWLLRFLPNHKLKLEMIPFHFRRKHDGQYHLKKNVQLIEKLKQRASEIIDAHQALS